MRGWVRDDSVWDMIRSGSLRQASEHVRLLWAKHDRGGLEMTTDDTKDGKNQK
jgi:hypothetical protein